MSENEELNKQEEIIQELRDIEQLDDVEFEKENEEKKKKSSKKNIIVLIISLIVLAAIVFAIYYFVFKATPQVVVDDFIISFNSNDYEKCLELIDLQGNYALGATGDGEDVENAEDLKRYYTKFDAKYEEAKDSDDYKEFAQLMSEIEADDLKEIFDIMTFTITDIEEPVLIQNTKGLYKISANVDMKVERKTQSEKVEFYVNRVGNEYKLVGGELIDLFLFAPILY